MPISITNISYSDEWNSGTSNNVKLCAGDEITANITYQYSNLFDAGSLPSTKIKGVDGSVISPMYSGLQAFQFIGLFTNLDSEFSIPDIEVTTDLGGGGNFTVRTIQQLVSTGEQVLICNEANSIGATGNNASIWISETFTNANFNVNINSQNNGQAEPTPIIKTFPDGDTTGFFDNAFDVTNLVAKSLPYSIEGAWKNGSLEITGGGLSGSNNEIQTFSIEVKQQLLPITLYLDDDNGGLTDVGGYNLNTSSLGNNFFYYRITPFLTSANINDVISGQTETLQQRYKHFDSSLNSAGLTTPANYTKSNFSIVRTSDSEASTKPIIQEKFTVSFDIDNATDSPFSNANTPVKVGIEVLPISYDYNNFGANYPANANYEQTSVYDYSKVTLGDAAASGVATGDNASITNYVTTYNSNDQISVSFDVEFTANAILQINDEDDVLINIWCEVQDHTTDYNTTDRTNVNVYFGEAIQKILSDPIEVVSTQFITAPYSQWGNGIDASEIDGFPVQLLCASTRFFANWDNRPNLRIRNVTQSLVLKNSSTLEEITLEDETINVQAFPLASNTYPVINYDINKGYAIPSDEIRNRVRMYNDGDAANTHFFNVQFPFFIRWESYTELILNQVPASILDYTKNFDGKNYDVNRIDNLADWSLNYRLNFDCEEDGVEFSQDFDETISTTGYNEHPEVNSRTIRTFEEDGVNQLNNGATNFIDNDGKTLIEVTYNLKTAATDVDEFEIEFYLEGKQLGSPTKTQRISSINGLLSSSWFSSLDGSGLIEKSISSGNAVAKAYIDNSKLAIYDEYTFYSTIYTPPRPEEFILTESGENITTESGENLIR